MDSVSADGTSEQAGASAVYFDGASSRRRSVKLAFSYALKISEEGAASVVWAFDDIRQADSPAGMLRVSCLSASPLARLEIRDAVLAAELTSRCTRLGENRIGRGAIAKIVGWSVAAAASIVLVVLFAIPLAADRLAPLVPDGFERVGVEAIREGVVDEERGQGQEVGIAGVLDPVVLERAQIIRVAQLGPQLLEEGPVPLLALLAHLDRQESLQVGSDGVVVEERVVHVEEEHDAGRSAHPLRAWASSTTPRSLSPRPERFTRMRVSGSSVRARPSRIT